MKKKGFRLEVDTLGPVYVPEKAYYGAQTARAIKNFPISGIPPEPQFIKATAMVKKAAAGANSSLGLHSRKKANAIKKAADEIIRGRLHDQFVIDVYQAGAGTSHNMNANEVIANRAIEILGGQRGEYNILHPNDDVNMGQSTNDTFPTFMRIAALLSLPALTGALSELIKNLQAKAADFNEIIKSGRTHLQDAVPVTLGSEFAAYASIVSSSLTRIEAAGEDLKRIGLGGTAVGTGLNTAPAYRTKALRELSKVSGIKGLKKTKGGESFTYLSSMGDFLNFSGTLRGLAVGLVKIANDLRLLSSGPRTGIGEIKLPAVQPGSSIMPGKVNPVMAEMLNMVCFQVIGNDTAITTAAQAGQFELNVMGPVINYNILQSMKILTSAATSFTKRCLQGIKAVPARCLTNFEGSVALATLLNPLIGYEKAALVAKESEKTGRSVREIVIERGLMDEKTWKKMLSPKKVTRPAEMKKNKARPS
ncbi:MAG: aspartate ammonia-lyase [Thermodesulfobacteriota bacterium]